MNVEKINTIIEPGVSMLLIYKDINIGTDLAFNVQTIKLSEHSKTVCVIPGWGKKL